MLWTVYSVSFISLTQLLSPSLSIFVKLDSKPAIFGKDVILFCNASSIPNCCANKTRRWYGGPGKEILTLNEKPYFSKYESDIVKDGFNLAIHNFSASDINTRYICSYGVDSYEAYLELDDNFEKYPDSKSYTIHKTEKRLNLSISFSEVYPEPICTVDFDNIDLTGSLVTNSKTENLFYNTEIFYNGTTVLQCGVLIVNCTVGSKSFRIINETLRDCESATNEQSPVLISILILISLLFIVICIVAVVLYKAYCMKSNKKGRYDGSLQNASEMNQCTAI